MVLLI
jgi:hypothetical protein